MNLPTTNYFYNITLFKRFYIFFCIIFSLIQFYLSSSLNDFLLVFLVLFLNLFTVLYCFNSKIFFKFPISCSIIFFSSLMSLGGCIFFKSLELSHISKGLYAPNITINLIFFSNIIIILSHLIYTKALSQNNFLLKLNKKLGLFETDKNIFLFLGFISIFIMLISRIIISEDTLEFRKAQGVPLWFALSKPLMLFYIAPFILLFSKTFFKTETKINILIILLLLFIIFLISFGTNRRDILFYGCMSIFLSIFIIYLLNDIEINKKQFFKIIVILIFFLFSYNKLVQFNYIYLYERGTTEGRSFYDNIKSFQKTLKNSSKVNINRNYDFIKNEMSGEYGNYYDSIIFERLNFLEYSDNIVFFKKNISSKSLIETKAHILGRIISIIPGPIIKIFNKDFDKGKFIYVTNASYIHQKYDPRWNGNNNVGSFIAENYILFGNFMFIFLLFISIIYFYILDAFYEKNKKIFSIFLIFFLFHTTTQLGYIFAAASIDILSGNLRNITQTVIYYIVLKKIYNFFTKKEILK